MKLTVLNVAYPLAPVGPDSVGGAEQILTLMDQALVEAGHESIVVACEGSKTAGRLVPTPVPPGTLSDDVRRRVQQQHLRRIEEALNRYLIDVIHMHGIDFHAYLPPAGVPALVTLHLPPGWYPPDVFHLTRPDTHLHCVSRAQRAACPPGAVLLPEIENGVAVESLAFRCRKRHFAITLGRICPEKNFHTAIDAATRAGMPILVGGQVFPYEAHERYFREQIAPRLGPQVRFLGPVGLARKRRLLSAARCFLMTSLAPETSSLVSMEALACGTPVIAFRSGALPEIVEHGVTGFIVDSEQEMVEAIAQSAGLDCERCREAARKRFSVQAMVQKYFEAYERLARPAHALRHAEAQARAGDGLEDATSHDADHRGDHVYRIA